MTNTLETIIKDLAVRLSTLGFVSKSGGLLQEQTIVTSGTSTVRATAQVAPFSTGKMVDVSPDKSDSCITFFTAGATRVLRQDLYVSQLENEIVLTGWINGNKVSGGELSDPELIVMTTIRKARIRPEPGSPIRSVEIDFASDGDAVNVSRWGLDAPDFQYGGYPHRFFQLKFRVSYTIATGCATQSVHVLNPAC